jgi:Ca2+/Na+ antiporter
MKFAALEELYLRHNMRPIVRGILIVVFLMVVVLLFFLVLKPIDVWDIIELILFSLGYTGVMLFLTAKSGIKPREDGLRIRWFSWLRGKSIQDTEIEKIILGRHYIRIIRKNEKPVKLILEPLEKDVRTRVYEFFIEYSKQKNLELERQLHL